MTNALALPSSPDPAAWERAARDWLEARRSERTRAAYATAWAAFLAFAGVAPWAVTRAHVIAWRDHLEGKGGGKKKAPATVAQRLAALSSFYRYARHEGLIERNPTEGVERPPVRAYDKAEAMTEAQARAVLRLTSNTPRGRRDRALLALALTTGLRRAELLGLRRCDVLESPRPAIRYTPKGGAEETRRLPGTAWQALRLYLEDLGDVADDAPIFPLSAQGLRYIVRRYTLAATGHAYNPHELRHTAATILYEATGDGRAVQELLGHARRSTTDLYLHKLADRRDALGDVIGDALGL